MTGSRQAHDKGRRLRMQRQPHARRTRGNASDVARHLAGLEAGRAHVEALGGAVDESTHTLDVGVPPAVGPHVGVRDALAEDGALAADVANSSHGVSLLIFNLKTPRLGKPGLAQGHVPQANRLRQPEQCSVILTLYSNFIAMV